MGVSVNKTRQDYAAARIDHLAVTGDQRLHLAASSNLGDAAFMDQQRAVINDRKVAQLRPDAWSRWAGKRYQLLAVYYRE
jgi:hypothetical protein